VNYEIELDTALSKLIDYSINHYPRSYFISSYTDRNQPITNSTYTSFLKSLGLNISSFRKAFVTKYYEDSNFRELVSKIQSTQGRINLEQKEYLARLMRHNTDTQEKYYVKKDKDNQNVVNRIESAEQEIKQIEQKEEKREEKKQEEKKDEQPMIMKVEKKKPGPKPKYQSTSEYMKVYKRLHQDKLNEYQKTFYEKDSLKQKARTYVRKLNLPEGTKDHIKSPSDKKVDEYKLINFNGRWKSNLLKN
jgi:ribosomal protein L12E/L44/L45/RPP1/RPP2